MELVKYARRLAATDPLKDMLGPCMHLVVDDGAHLRLHVVKELNPGLTLQTDDQLRGLSWLMKPPGSCVVLIYDAQIGSRAGSAASFVGDEN